MFLFDSARGVRFIRKKPPAHKPTSVQVKRKGVGQVDTRDVLSQRLRILGLP